MTADNAEELRQILFEVIQTHEAELGRRDELGLGGELYSRLLSVKSAS
jgi:hypothetical protein